MNRQQLKQKLSDKYTPENWKDILKYIFPNVALFQIPQDIPVTNEKVKSFRQLGNVRLNDGKSLAVFDIQLKDNVDITRNRVELRNLTTKYIDQEETHGVLAVFASASEDYRFTFTAQETEFDENMQLVTKQTEPKRYTYVLGPNESCQTASDRFYKLHEQKDTVSLENVVDAFSVEKLNKEFFNKYKEHYEDFVQFITGKRFKKVGGKGKEVEIHEPNAYLESVFENDNKQARDFVKKLLGRMVFLQFLQKKGWMGCSSDSSEWENGDYTYCKSLFESANQDQFHSNYLAHLFDALNTSNRENDVFDLTQTRVPYLNGGLFEADNDAIRKIDFPASHFESLLSFFGEYNFTIDENDPNDHEVGIDPEMLGHIFENLLEDNKDKGAFYTPKPIVQYMCQKSLIQYLKTHLENETKDIENFIRTLDKGDENNPNNYILQNAKKIEELLDNVRICDPAIGSGAFPMGLLQIIFRTKMSLDWTLEPAEVKRGIIQNSIYGVDIEKGAVDIARLRFWLSLIVDEKAPKPLPNLDYKIMQGNSLLESFEGVDLSQIGQGEDITILEPEADLFGNIKEEQLSVTQTKSGLKQEIQNLIDAYFSLMGIEEKQKVKAKINTKIHEHIDFNLELQELQTQQFINQAGNPQYFTPKAKKKVDNWQNELDRLKSKRQNLHALQNEEEKPYFLWHLFFADVFKDGGFDIVIANPPYVNTKDVSKYDWRVDLENEFGWVDDLYNHFTHLAVNFTKENGIVTFITSDTFFTIQTKRNMRKLLLENQIIHLIPTPKAFSAMVDTAIFIVKKKSNPDNYKLKFSDIRKPDFDQLGFSNQYIKSGGGDIATWERILDPLFSNLKFSNKYTSIINVNIFRENLNQVFFSPTNMNLKIKDRVIPGVRKLYDVYWELIKTSRDIAKNASKLNEYRNFLKPGDVTILGIITDGGVGLQTGNNGRFVGCLQGTKSANRIIQTRGKKLLEAFKMEKKLFNLYPSFMGCSTKNDFDSTLKEISEHEIREMFDEIKLKTDRDIFAQGYLFRIIDPTEIADIDTMTNDEKLNGIDNDRRDHFVLYDKGDKDGNRWFGESPYFIDWSIDAVNILKTDKKARWQGYNFFFRAGFCWSDIHTTYLKSRIKLKGVHDVKSMSLFNLSEKISTKFIICIINSSFASKFQQEFYNNTSSFQINDARKLPIIIPTPNQLNEFEDVFDRSYTIKEKQFTEEYSKEITENQLADIQKELDELVYKLYGFSKEEIAIVEDAV